MFALWKDNHRRRFIFPPLFGLPLGAFLFDSFFCEVTASIIRHSMLLHEKELGFLIMQDLSVLMQLSVKNGFAAPKAYD